MPDATTAGIAMLLLFNVAAAGLLLPFRLGVSVAIFASLAMAAEYTFNVLGATPTDRPLAEVIMFAVSYLAVGYLASQAGQRARSSQALADQRGVEVANLAEVNELIIRRMRTGVLVVDAENRIKLSNEAASLLIGDGSEGENDSRGMHLPQVAPELARRLDQWRNGWKNEETPMQLSPDQPEVQPRFARLLAGSELSLVFLDDSSVVSRRAESLTLTALGRFSASLAHEIRNPLAAINYRCSCWRNPGASSTVTAAYCRSSTSSASAPTASSRACSAWPAASAPVPSTWTSTPTCAASSTSTAIDVDRDRQPGNGDRIQGGAGGGRPAPPAAGHHRAGPERAELRAPSG